jgi:hypothetical protein
MPAEMNMHKAMTILLKASMFCSVSLYNPDIAIIE